MTSISQFVLVRMTGAPTTPLQPGTVPAVAPSVTLAIETDAPAPIVTARVAVRFWPPTVVEAVMTALPCDTPVMAHVEEPAVVVQPFATVATDGVSEDHTIGEAV